MGKLGYYFRMFKGRDKKLMNHNIDIVKKDTGWGKLRILISMTYCFLRYGAGPNDYVISSFYTMKHKNRKTFVTRTKNKKIIEYLNNKEFSYIFDNKSTFNSRFNKYLKKGFIDAETCTEKEFEMFIKKHKYAFCKPPIGDSGRGIEKLYLKDFDSSKEMLKYIKEKKITCIEEGIIQHKDMNSFNPNAVNCVRVVTVLNGKDVLIPYVVVKFGVGKHFVDNMGKGTYCAPVDINTGIITSFAFNEHGDHSDIHPDTKKKFEGFKIPYFKETIELAKKAAMEVPEIRQVGWDIGISESGPDIVEGNDWTDYLFWQRPEQIPNRIGLLPFYKEIIPKL